MCWRLKFNPVGIRLTIQEQVFPGFVLPPTTTSPVPLGVAVMLPLAASTNCNIT